MTKSERLLNLLILLLVQRHPVAKQKIRELVPSYREATDEAFERMFDRDKDELRALGVPIEVASLDAYFEEPGYRVRAEEFALPGIDLTADEAAVVGLATRVWQHAGLAGATGDALAKLAAAGVEVDRSRLDAVAPVVTVEDPHFDTFWQASLERTRVRFAHRSAGAAAATVRTLEPWGVVSYAGRWYVVGRDVDRDAERVFRLSRVEGEVTRVGRAGAYDVPADVDLREVLRRLAPGEPGGSATVLVRSGTCLGLRRAASDTEPGVTGPDEQTGWDRLEVPYGTVESLVDEVLSFGADACLAGPDEARTLLVGRLSAVVGEAS